MKTFDKHKNLAYSNVAIAPSPNTSGTSLVVTGGDGSKFPAVPFNATLWPTGVQPVITNAEIVRVTNIVTDTFTIIRAQEGTTAQPIVPGFQIAAGITAKTIDDIESAFGDMQTDGWNPLDITLTFVSADSQISVVTVPTDLTAKYKKSMKFKMTNGGTVKYFKLAIDPTYSSGTGLTTFTFCGGGTDSYYELAASAITLVYYSVSDCPLGWNTDEDYWTIYVNVTSDTKQASPSQNTWYNHTNIVKPIGLYKFMYNASLGGYLGGGGSMNTSITLSTANNSQSNILNTENVNTGVLNVSQYGAVFCSDKLTETAKTTYYLNFLTKSNAAGEVGIFGSSGRTTVIKLIPRF
jgi:hypothetical protein